MSAHPKKANVQPESNTPTPAPATESASSTQPLRTLAHDLSNALETIMQASYLLSHAELDETNKRWLEMIDKATRDAARINREIRDILRGQAAK